LPYKGSDERMISFDLILFSNNQNIKIILMKKFKDEF